MNKNKIWLSSPHMSGFEFEFVKDAFETNWIAPLGPHVDGFENDICEFTGIKFAAALSSGTSAIHLALIMLNVKQGDYVICQSFTFSGSANPIIYQGAIPVFIDSETETWNMSPAYLEKAITDLKNKNINPKAIIPVHLYGMPAKIDQIMDIAGRYNIPVIEDAAEALGSKINEKHCGTFGDIGVLSFNGNKIITTSGGGALISDNEFYVKQARFLATQARDLAPHYQHSQIGYNYRLSNVCAAIGRGQMKVLNERIRQRRNNFYKYQQLLGKIKGIKFLNEPPGFFSNRWLTCILVEPKETNGITREHIRIAMENENIECRPLWKPMHLQPVFKNALFYGNGTCEELFEKGLCLPSGSNLTEDDFERIFDVLLSFFK